MELKSTPLAWLTIIDPSGHFDYLYAIIYEMQPVYFANLAYAMFQLPSPPTT